MRQALWQHSRSLYSRWTDLACRQNLGVVFKHSISLERQVRHKENGGRERSPVCDVALGLRLQSARFIVASFSIHIYIGTRNNISFRSTKQLTPQTAHELKLHTYAHMHIQVHMGRNDVESLPFSSDKRRQKRLSLSFANVGQHDEVRKLHTAKKGRYPHAWSRDGHRPTKQANE